MRRKLAVILAADVASYSRLVADDEDDTLRRLNASLELFKDLIAHHGGRVFNTAGDAVLAEFSSALEALRCAIEVQESLKTRNLAYAPSRRLEFRVAVHIGDVFEENGNLLGDGVNVAARLESIAPIGGICVSRIVHDAIAGKIAVRFADMGNQSLKNIPEPVRAYALPISESGVTPARRGNEKTPLPKPLVPASAIVGLGGLFIGLLVAGSVWLFKPSPKPPETAAAHPVPPVAAAVPPSIPVPPAPSPPSPFEAAAPPAPSAAPQKPAMAEDKADPLALEPLARPVPGLATVGQPTQSQPASTVAGQAERQLSECRAASVAEAVKICTMAAAATGLDVARQAEAQALLGNALRDAGDVSGAATAFNRSVELRPTAEAFIGRGIAKFQRRDFDGAVADFDKAIDLVPNSGEAFNNRAWTRYRQGNAVAALVDADKAVALMPAKAYVWDTRAHIHEALGNRELAIRDYRKAIAADPAGKSSQEGLARLLAKP